MSRLAFLTAVFALVVGGTAGCRDQLPTATGPDQFPAGTLLNSWVLELPAADYLEQLGEFTGYTDVRDAGYGLVANLFEGGLQARTLARLEGFPDSVTYTAAGVTRTDSVFEYTDGEVVASLDTVASLVDGSVTLRLHAVTQEWDPGSATWTFASDTAGTTVPWTQPGASLGPELSRTTWVPGDTLQRDTIRWEVDSLSVAQMAAEGFPGLIVVAEESTARVQLGPISLRTGVRPEAHPDTVLAQTISGGARTFIFTPEPPQPAAPPGRWWVGGIGSARVLFRVTLPDRLRACPPEPLPGGACADHALRDVTLNEVALLLRPDTVAGGLRLLAPTIVRMRTVPEPELGRRAPLGPPVVGRFLPGLSPLFADAVVTRDLFSAPTDTVVTLVLTDHFRSAIARDTTEERVSTAFALLAEPEGARFGYSRFVSTPTLRIVFTLPVQRTSP